MSYPAVSVVDPTPEGGLSDYYQIRRGPLWGWFPLSPPLPP